MNDDMPVVDETKRCPHMSNGTCSVCRDLDDLLDCVEGYAQAMIQGEGAVREGIKLALIIRPFRSRQRRRSKG